MTEPRVCSNCAYDDLEAYEYPCNKCEASYDNPPSRWEPIHKPQTNADRIRGMTDKELAYTMSIWCIATEDCAKCPWYNVNCPESEYMTDWLEWLQQPYKEDDNG